MVEFPAASCVIDSELIVDIPNIHVFGNNSVLIQNNSARGGVRIQADNVKISGFSIINGSRRERLRGGDYFGSLARDRVAGVTVYDANMCVLSDLMIENFNAGIYLTGSQSRKDKNVGTKVFGVTTSKCDMGVLFTQQDELRLSNIQSFSITNVQGVPPHCVYGSEHGGENGLVMVSDLYCGENDFDSGFKFKGCTLSGGNLTGKSSTILLQLERCAGQLTSMSLFDQKRTASYTSQAVNITQSPYIRLSNLLIKRSAYRGKVFRIHSSPGVRLENASVETTLALDRGESPFIIEERSDDVMIINSRYVDHSSTPTDRPVFQIANSDRVGIVSPEVFGTDRIALFQGKSTNGFVSIFPPFLKNGLAPQEKGLHQIDQSHNNDIMINVTK